MLTAVQSAALNGVEAYGIRIEVDVGQGAQYFLVGLPDNAVRESWKRMESAIRSSGLRMPRQRIVINLAPADRRKQGSGFDLPMALGILAASGQIPAEPLQHLLFLGELALDGSLRPVPGCLSAALYAREIGCSGIVVAAANAMETAMAPGIDVLAATDLASVIRHIKGESTLVATERTERATIQSLSEEGPDFSDVRGQAMPKRALEIAAAGGHNVLMVGPPGSGKTMLARRLPGILPAPDWSERLDITRIYSVAGILPENGGLMESRPFRAPHHTCSDVSLVGGGTSAQPGEITLAHFGVLFLDELPEFRRSVLEVLRQPIEEGRITISRARYSVEYPAAFQLIGSMNACPCGYSTHPDMECTCHPTQIIRYRSRISGPLLDRFDLHLEVQPVPVAELPMGKDETAESSACVRQRVEAARAIQRERFTDEESFHVNARMPVSMVRRVCRLDTNAASLLQTAIRRLKLSARGYERILKVARTIADLDAEVSIRTEHLAEAIGYRSMDRLGGG